jgi:hypothetical protein
MDRDECVSTGSLTMKQPKVPAYLVVVSTGSLTMKQPKVPAYLVVADGSNGYGPYYSHYETLEEAQAKAEEIAPKSSSDVFILKAVRRVAPKRDVVTTEL